MRNFLFQTTIVSMVLVTFFASLYAHHGTDFLLKAMEMNTAGVRFAEMAPSRTQNPKIKEFAQMLVRDHNQALDEMSELRDIRLADSNQQRKYSTAELRRDIDTVDFANAALPTLQEHLQQAEAIQREL